MGKTCGSKDFQKCVYFGTPYVGHIRLRHLGGSLKPTGMVILYRRHIQHAFVGISLEVELRHMHRYSTEVLKFFVGKNLCFFSSYNFRSRLSNGFLFQGTLKYYWHWFRSISALCCLAGHIQERKKGITLLRGGFPCLTSDTDFGFTGIRGGQFYYYYNCYKRTIDSIPCPVQF